MITILEEVINVYGVLPGSAISNSTYIYSFTNQTYLRYT